MNDAFVDFEELLGMFVFEAECLHASDIEPIALDDINDVAS